MKSTRWKVNHQSEHKSSWRGNKCMCQMSRQWIQYLLRHFPKNQKHHKSQHCTDTREQVRRPPESGAHVPGLNPVFKAGFSKKAFTWLKVSVVRIISMQWGLVAYVIISLWRSSSLCKHAKLMSPSGIKDKDRCPHESRAEPTHLFRSFIHHFTVVLTSWSHKKLSVYEPGNTERPWCIICVSQEKRTQHFKGLTIKP